MPRAKPTRGVDGWIVKPIIAKPPKGTRLKPDDKARLRTLYDAFEDLAEVPSAQAAVCVQRVVEAIEMFPGLRDYGDIPTVASRRAAALALADRVEALKCELNDLDPTLRDEIDMAGADRSALLTQLQKIDRALSIVETKHDGWSPILKDGKPSLVQLDGWGGKVALYAHADVSSQGRPADRPRRIVFDLIATEFHEVERGEANDYAARLKDFIVAACSLSSEIKIPREDRILDYVSPPLKVPRSIP